jgi:tripartite-type tricarboxylate transporter receptor subunit TctC
MTGMAIQARRQASPAQSSEPAEEVRCAAHVYPADASALCVLLRPVVPSRAEAVTEFYRQRTITFVSVFAPGGTYDLYSRLVANHLQNYIPGKPKIIVRYMPGAGGLNGAIHLAAQAPQDGTEIGIVDRAIAVNQVQLTVSVPLDASKFQWIGSVSSYGGVLQVAGRRGTSRRCPRNRAGTPARRSPHRRPPGAH